MIWIWIAFIAFVLLMLALDLGVFHRKAHVVTVKEALAWSAVWLTLGLAFAVFVYFAYDAQWFGLGSVVDAVDGLPNDGSTATEKYLTGYIVEKSLSVDNIFVIAMIFSFFAVPPLYQHRVLFWGILGALLLRGAMIAIGAKLIAEFHWVLYLFAVFLILTAIKMLFLKTEHTDPNKNIVVRLTRRLFPVTARFHGEHFIVRAGRAGIVRERDPRCARGARRGRRGGSTGDTASHASRAGTRHGRDDGCHLRGGLDSGDLCHYERPIPGFHQQRIRDPGSPVALFRPGRDGEEVPIPEGLARTGPDGSGREDAACRMAEARAREALQLVLADCGPLDPGSGRGQFLDS